MITIVWKKPLWVALVLFGWLWVALVLFLFIQ